MVTLYILGALKYIIFFNPPHSLVRFALLPPFHWVKQGIREVKLPSQSHTASKCQDQVSNWNLLRFFLLHLRPSHPECLSQPPKAPFGPQRMENFQSNPSWPAPTGAPAWPCRFIGKVESVPKSQPHPDPGFLKWRQRLTGGSASRRGEGSGAPRGDAGASCYIPA